MTDIRKYDLTDVEIEAILYFISESFDLFTLATKLRQLSMYHVEFDIGEARMIVSLLDKMNAEFNSHGTWANALEKDIIAFEKEA